MYTPFSYWSTTCVDCVEQDVIIGTQTWMKCNLNVSTYRDGTPIPQVTDQTEWATTTTGSWCYVNNDPATEATYGKLYNWIAVNNTINGGLAPVGYHIPTVAEFGILTGSLGGESVAGAALKQRGLCTWVSPNAGATNSSGFTAVGAGFRQSATDGTFVNIGQRTHYWSSERPFASRGYSLHLLVNQDNAFNTVSNDEHNGHSVRCVKD